MFWPFKSLTDHLYLLRSLSKLSSEASAGVNALPSLPVYPSLPKLFVTCLPSFGVLQSLVLKVAIYLSFYGFLRPDEFTSTGPNSVVLYTKHLKKLDDH